MSDTSQRNARIALGIGTAAILAALLANEWLLERFVSSDQALELTTRWLVRGAQLLLLSAGGLFIALRRRFDPVTLVVAGGSLVAGLGVMEAVLAVTVRTNRMDGFSALRLAAEQIYRTDRSYLQYLPECARYDAELAYTLRPGECDFETPEFQTHLRVNRAGLRDDESSLEAPEIVVLGDSYAMGWGVEDAQAFPQVLEELTGLRVLNAGVSSYGTAREILSLGRIDLSRLKVLVVQYCEHNDVAENLALVEGNGSMKIMSEREYAQHVQPPTRYLPGRYLWRLLQVRLVWPALGAIRSGLGASPARDDADDEEERAILQDPRRAAELFLDVVSLAPVELGDTPIVVLDLTHLDRNDDRFVEALESAGENAGFALSVLRLKGRLSKQHYFRLDEHINAAGHREVATLLAKKIGPLVAGGNG